MDEEDFDTRARRLRMHNRKRRPKRYKSLLWHWLWRLLRARKEIDAGPLPTPLEGQVAVTFVGHATCLIRYPELTIACDPHLRHWRGFVRREEEVWCDEEALAAVNLILISNGSPDHLDPKSLARFPRSATVIVPSSCSAQISPLGFARLIELAPQSNVEHRGVDVRAFEATQARGEGPALAFVIRGSGPSVVFCGASGYAPMFREIGASYRPDIALLPIGGYSPRSFRGSHLSPLDALYAFEDLRSKIMVPIRHGCFALSYERLSDPTTWLRSLVDERQLDKYVVEVTSGQSRIFVNPTVTARSDEEGGGARSEAEERSSPPAREEMTAPDSDGENEESRPPRTKAATLTTDSQPPTGASAKAQGNGLASSAIPS